MQKRKEKRRRIKSRLKDLKRRGFKLGSSGILYDNKYLFAYEFINTRLEQKVWLNSVRLGIEAQKKDGIRYEVCIHESQQNDVTLFVQPKSEIRKKSRNEKQRDMYLGQRAIRRFNRKYKLYQEKYNGHKHPR